MEVIVGLIVVYCLAMAIAAVVKPKSSDGKDAAKKAVKTGWNIGSIISGFLRK